MKNFCIIHILLFILLMLVYQCASAQEFVVTAIGDTIRGSVKPLAYGPNKKVQVITADKQKKIFSILQVKGYSDEGESFYPVRKGEGYVFMKLVKGGYLSLYSYQLENQLSYDGLFLSKLDGTGVEVPNLSFKKIITRYLEDCATVRSRIDRGELTKKDISIIVDEYNECVSARTYQSNAKTEQENLQEKKLSPWETLEEKVKSKNDFEGKSDALEMIAEIKAKIKRDEKIPNFLLEGLKNALSKAELTNETEAAIKSVEN